MKLEIKINSTGFRAMTQELARLSGKEFSQVLRLEAASCIKRAALESKVASLTSLRRSIEQRDASRIIRSADGRVLIGRDTKGLGHVEAITYNTQRNEGRVWYIDHRSSADKKYMVFDAGPSRGHHLPPEAFARYEALAAEFPKAMKRLLADLNSRRGLERSSWLQMADDMQVDLAAVAPPGPLKREEASNANYRGRRFRNGWATDKLEGARFTIIVSNASPIAKKRGGQARLDRAIASRVKGFEIAMKKGLLDDLQRRARRWPGIFVAAA